LACVCVDDGGICTPTDVLPTTALKESARLAPTEAVSSVKEAPAKPKSVMSGSFPTS